MGDSESQALVPYGDGGVAAVHAVALPAIVVAAVRMTPDFVAVSKRLRISDLL